MTVEKTFFGAEMRVQSSVLALACVLAAALPLRGMTSENIGAANEASACPTPNALGDFCYAVATKRPSHDIGDDDSIYLHEYQRIVDVAACANIESDAPDDYSSKVRALWATSAPGLKCVVPGFSSVPKSAIKLAIRQQFKDVLIDATQVWKLDLNEVEEGDGMTVLDFTAAEIEANAGTINESVLRQYYELLRKAGSKHASEL